MMDLVVSRLARFAWAVLAVNVGVILWGAYVRATGSGAGCGSHWPLCNGEIIPPAPSVATLIEYSHRLTSGIALIAVVVMFVWTRRRCEPGHPARAAAGASLFFMLTEAGVGAGLVLFRLVADNPSMARAMFMAVHLMNTFALLASVALTAWWLSGAPAPRLAGRFRSAVSIGLGASAILLVSTSGAIAALGDTLFPASSLSEALRADLSTTSHAFIRLRILHPALAVVTAVALMFGTPRLARGHGAAALQLSRLVVTVAAIQVAAGVLNVALLAPVWMQMIHLLLADVVWVGFVLLSAQVLAAAPASERAALAMPTHRWESSAPRLR